MLREMARLKDHLEKSLHDKLEGLSGTARAARNIAIVTTLILIILGAGVSIKMSSSVTRPLVELAAKSKTGLYNGSAPALFSTIPEIQELSEVLAQQQQRLLQAAEHNADAIERLSEELATRLAVFKRSLNELKAQNGLLAEPADHAVMDSLIEDTEGLIQHCAEVSASVAARTALSKLEPQARQSADIINAPVVNIDSPARELPDPVRATQYPSMAGLANYASRLTSLWRQLKRPPSNAA